MNQLTLDQVASESAKYRGLDVHESQDRYFLDTMREAAIKISRESGFVTTDNLRIIADKLGLQPRHHNVWGSVFRGPHWKIVGRTRSAIEGNHAREIKIWRYEP